MRFAIFGNEYQASKSVNIKQLFSLFRKYQDEICIQRNYYEFISNEFGINIDDVELIDNYDCEADMVISVGGDGTFLKVATNLVNKDIPVLGINMGRLGFLADISPNEIEEAMEEIHRGEYVIDERTMLKVLCNNASVCEHPYALNEVAILKRDTASMITIDAWLNNKFLTTYQSDGLIIATPTGSTAYSLSVGGPIMFPKSRTIALSPIAPHSLSLRPIVLDDNYVIKLKISSRSDEFLIGIDGRSEICSLDTEISIRKAAKTIKVVKRSDYNFFDTLREKMMWGVDYR